MRKHVPNGLTPMSLVWAEKPGQLSLRFDHTLITRRGPVGASTRKRPAWYHLESATYDWIGPPRTARIGFDSR
jgi:hypothetical protein